MSSFARCLGQPRAYVRPLAPAALAKVAHLHDFGQRRLVHRALGLLCVVALENVHVLVERALVVVLLQEALAAPLLLLPRLPRVREVLLEALRLGQRTAPLDLLALLALLPLLRLEPLDARELTKAPGGKLGIGVDVVRVIDLVRGLFVLLLAQITLHTLGRKVMRSLALRVALRVLRVRRGMERTLGGRGAFASALVHRRTWIQIQA